MKFVKCVRCLLISLTIVIAGAAGAQSVPPLVNYQGRLANSDGTPFPTADYSLTVRIWDAPTNGTLVWGPQRFDGAAGPGHGPRIPVVQGYFNLMLGPVDTNGVSIQEAFAGPERFVEVALIDRSPILPRQRILSVPYSFEARNAAKLAGFDWSALTGTNDPTARPILWDRLPGRREVWTNVGVGGVAISGDSGNQTFFPSVSAVDVSGLSVSIATSGRPVFVGLIGGTNNNLQSFIQAGGNGLSNVYGDIQLVEGTNVVYRSDFQLAAVSSPLRLTMPASSFSTILTPPSGSHTYRIQVLNISGWLVLHSTRLIAYEL